MRSAAGTGCSKTASVPRPWRSGHQVVGRTLPELRPLVAATVPMASSRLRLDLPHEDEHRLRAHLGWEPRRDHIDG